LTLEPRDQVMALHRDLCEEDRKDNYDSTWGHIYQDHTHFAVISSLDTYAVVGVNLSTTSTCNPFELGPSAPSYTNGTILGVVVGRGHQTSDPEALHEHPTFILIIQDKGPYYERVGYVELGWAQVVILYEDGAEKLASKRPDDAIREFCLRGKKKKTIRSS
jgi:hypothetical protein